MKSNTHSADADSDHSARSRLTPLGTRKAFPWRVPVYITAILVIAACATLAYRFYINPAAKSATLAMAKGQYEVAIGFYVEEAAKGNPAAQNSLANLYYLGLGVPADANQATQWYFKAASQGFAPAQLNLGNLYSQGIGVPNDAMRAFAWYKMSNMYGNPAAERYMTQIAIEYTLSPLQINTVNSKWPSLDLLVAEGLQ